MLLRQFIARVIEGPTPFALKGRDYTGLDCWGLIHLAYREVLNIQLPSYADDYLSTRPSESLGIVLRQHRAADGWDQVTIPMPMDVVVLRMAGVPTHCGLIVSPMHMLHVLDGTHTCIEPWDGLLWCRRVDGFWRRGI